MFAVRGDKGEVALMFVTANDLPGAKTQHQTYGFFADAPLTQKVSSSADAGFGDTTHEKLVLTEGEARTVYARERTGERWRLDVKRNGDRIQLKLRPVPQGAR